MLDLEPRVINKIQTSSYKNLYNSGQYIVRREQWAESSELRALGDQTDNSLKMFMMILKYQESCIVSL